MWNFTKDGFFSLVQHRTECDKFLVRARAKDDLERLAAKVNCDVVISEVPEGDYRWSAPVDKAQFTLYMIDELAALDYTTNVKGHIDCGDDKRHSALLRVWSAMMLLQDDPGRYHSAAEWYDADDLDPVDIIDAEDIVSVDKDGSGYQVLLWSQSGEPSIINTFATQDEADTLARTVRDTVASWPGFTDYNYNHEGMFR